MKEMVYTTTPKREWLMHSFYKGFEFVIMSLGTHPTAYVGVTKDNPLYGKHYSDDDFPLLSCNGGITYTEPSIRDEDGNLVGTYKWWIGWDYNHSWDYNPKLAEDFELFSIDFTGYSHKKWSTEEIFKEVKEVIDELEMEKKRMYQKEDIRKILIDLKNKVEACNELGLSDLMYSLNEALNCIEDLTGLDAYLEDVRRDD